MNRALHICIGIFMLTGMILLSQCSPRAGKSLLHFFFDGVPDADTAQLAGADTELLLADSAAFPEEPQVQADARALVHYPYGEQDCSSCHDELSLGSMVEPQPDLCYICHEDLSGTYNYLHGPVAGGYCTACHDPHRSENKYLLKMTGEDLCFYCHQEKSVLKNEMHQDLEGMQCMDCHNPHGGDDKYMFQ